MIGCSNTDVKGLAPMGASVITSKLKEMVLKVSEKNQQILLDWAYTDTNRTNTEYSGLY